MWLLAAVTVFGAGLYGCQLLSGVSEMSFATGGGASGGANSATSGTGGASGCKSVTDCPEPSTACETRVCLNEKCGFVAVPSGTQANEKFQTPGDCLTMVCNGSGETIAKADSADPFDDGSDCTEDGCVEATSVNTPKPLATACGSDKKGKCDGAGKCRECLSASDCGTSSECLSFSCKDGACVKDFAPKDTPLALQTNGDCQLRVCDGSGNEASIDKNDDVPDDGIV
jgi:hypothetical protein